MMLEMFAYPFMQRAFIAGVLIAIVAGFLGPFIVQRRMAFVGTGLAHGAFGGVALGMWMGVHPLMAAIPFTLLLAVVVVLLRQRSRLPVDTIIGILFTTAMALGVVFLAQLNSYSGDAFQYLFGSLLGVGTEDILASAFAVCAVGLSLRYWGRWAYATFDPDLARADRVNINHDEMVLTLFIAAAIVVMMKVVGLILASAFLVIPAATARILTRTFGAMAVASVAIAVGSTLAGLTAAFYIDVPSGAAMVLTQSAVFIIVFLFRRPA